MMKNMKQTKGDKRKTIVIDKDLSKPFKEVLKCPFTRRIIKFLSPSHMMPMNVNIYDGTACAKDPRKISKIMQKANGSILIFKESIPKIVVSSFMSSHKCSELAKCFLDSIPKIVDEMLKRVDDYGRSEEAYRDTELSKVRNSYGIKQAQPLGERSEAERKRGTKGKRSPKGQDNKHEEDIMVEAQVEGYLVYDIHMDEGEIMYGHYFNMLYSSIRVRLTKTQTTVSGFSGDQVKPLGKIELAYALKGTASYPDQLVAIGKNLSPEGSAQLKALLKKNKDIFCMGAVRHERATYRWLFDAGFKSQIGQNLEAYVDDMVVKSKIEKEMIAYVAETFDNLRMINMKLNREKLPKETLYIYIASSKEAVSAMLLVERKGKQCPVQRLRRYCDAHPIKVITDHPIKQILNKAKTSKKLAKYSVELGAYDITYEPRRAIKGQVLANFINEVPTGSDALVPLRMPYTIDQQTKCKEERVLYTDGASNIKGSEAGLVLISPTKTEYTYAMRLNFTRTNIQVDQINGNYEVSNGNMVKYLAKAKEYIGRFKKFKIKNIPQNQNQKADVLSKLASMAFSHLTKEILVEVLEAPLTYRGPVQEVVLNAYASVYRSVASQLRHPRDIHGSIQHAPEGQVGGSKGNPGIDVLGPLPEAHGK
nr:hypothetical protein [Tanacetum cinerariifolium]